MQKLHYKRLLRAGEPQPYLEPRSPRLKLSSHGLIHSSVAMRALGLDGIADQALASSVNGEGGESGATGGAASCEGGDGVREEEGAAEEGAEDKVKVKPAPGTLYADLGEFEPVNLLSFAYQIASGMVSKTLPCVYLIFVCQNVRWLPFTEKRQVSYTHSTTIT